MKWISNLFLIGAVCFIGYGTYHLYDQKVQVSKSHSDAVNIITEKKEEWVEEETKRYVPPMGEAVGLLKIDKLNSELPIVEGTDPDDLEKGVGHYKGSFYPRENGQIVLSGHRDTVFRRAGELKIGDTLKMILPYGEFTYRIKSTKIVEADDSTVIDLSEKGEQLILTTCYPFSYVGNAPQRYIIYAE